MPESFRLVERGAAEHREIRRRARQPRQIRVQGHSGGGRSLGCLRLDQGNQLADVLEVTHFGNREFDSKFPLDRKQQTNMSETVPVWDVLRGKVGSQRYGVVVKYIPEHLRQ